MKKILIITLVVVIAGIGIYAFMNSAAEGRVYANEKYGIRFTYPDGYVLQEAERGNAERGHYAIVIVSEADAVPRVDSEGPVAVTVDIYQNNIDKQTLMDWLTTTNASNFKLSNGTYASTTVAGAPAVSYKWSGLYEADTTAFLHRDNIVAVTATYITPQDETREVYRDLLSSIQLN